MEPARGIREDDVDIAHLDRLVHRLVAQRAGLHALLVGGHDPPGSLGPRLELLGGGGSEGISRHEHHLRAALLGEAVGELTDRRGLSAAVDAHDHDDRGPVALVQREGSGSLLAVVGADEDVHDGPLERRLDFRAGLDLTLLAPLPDDVQDVHRGRRAEVDAEEGVLELLERVLQAVEVPQREDLVHVAELLARLAGALEHAVEIALGLLRQDAGELADAELGVHPERGAPALSADDRRGQGVEDSSAALATGEGGALGRANARGGGCHREHRGTVWLRVRTSTAYGLSGAP